MTLRAAIACALAAVTGWAQPAASGVDPAFVGRWSGESIADDRGVQRWIVERGADVGAPRRIWRTATLAAGCMQLQALDPGSGRSLAPAWRFGECRVPAALPLPERTGHLCTMEGPGMKPGTLDLQIVRDPDGAYRVAVDGQREPQAVDVRDYPVLPDFKPPRSQTMTNAGEGMLMMVQMNADRSDALRRALGFDPGKARSVRAWVISPPRPERPMEYFSAGRFVLMQAFDADGRLLGGAAYTPFVVACRMQP